MARPLRIEYPDATYHVIARGNDHATIFRDDHDRKSFLAEIDRVTDRLDWNILAYCLMSTHYHLMVSTPNGDLARGMRDLNSIYADAFNRRHHRVGHLLQGRYKSPLVQTEHYLLALVRYIVRNPVRAGICALPEDWQWSSHSPTLGLAPAPRFLRASDMLAHFADTADLARRRYREYVDDAHGDAGWDPLRGRVVHGTPDFTAQAVSLAADRISSAVPRVQREVNRPSLGDLLTASSSGDDIVHAHRQHGYAISEIARLLGQHPTTIGRRIRSAEARLTPSPK